MSFKATFRVQQGPTKGQPTPLEHALSAARTDVPECLAVGYVDLSTGVLLGEEVVESRLSSVVALAAAATTNLFQSSGEPTSGIRPKGARTDQDMGPAFEEVLVFDEGVLHVYLRSTKNTDHAIVFVCRQSARVGAVLTKSRHALLMAESAL